MAYKLVLILLLVANPAAAQVKCAAYSQVNLQDATRVEYVFLDLPPRASQVTQEFWVRTTATPGADLKWNHCDAGTSSGAACDAVYFKDVSTGDPDGTKIYVFEVHPAPKTGSKYAFFGATTVRLVLRYTVPGTKCMAQYSYGVKIGHSVDVRGHPTELLIPAGKAIIDQYTFGKTPTGQWMSCGANAVPKSDPSPWVSGGQKWWYQDCVPRGGVGMEIWATSDKQDGAPGIKTRCGAPGGGQVVIETYEPFRCRFRITYFP